MTYYIVLPMQHTFVFVESSTNAVVITKRLAQVQIAMPLALVMSKRLFIKLTSQPISTREKVELLHKLYINVKAFCSKYQDNARRSALLFKRLVRQVSRIAAWEGSFSLAINETISTLGAE